MRWSGGARRLRRARGVKWLRARDVHDTPAAPAVRCPVRCVAGVDHRRGAAAGAGGRWAPCRLSCSPGSSSARQGYVFLDSWQTAERLAATRPHGLSRARCLHRMAPCPPGARALELARLWACPTEPAPPLTSQAARPDAPSPCGGPDSRACVVRPVPPLDGVSSSGGGARARGSRRAASGRRPASLRLRPSWTAPGGRLDSRFASASAAPGRGCSWLSPPDLSRGGAGRASRPPRSSGRPSCWPPRAPL
jgi:hypothetical protein